jgi:hypothetical protein
MFHTAPPELKLPQDARTRAGSGAAVGRHRGRLAMAGGGNAGVCGMPGSSPTDARAAHRLGAGIKCPVRRT